MGFVIFSIFLLVIGYFIGSHYDKVGLEYIKTNHPLRENDSSYKFINPLLAYETAPATIFEEYGPLENKLSKIVNDEIRQNKAETVSVYYKDLATGQWVGVNEDYQYLPASLLKAVIMIAYFKEAENNSQILENQFVYQNPPNVAGKNPFDAPSTLEIGKKYTVQELINLMIIDSDNGAKDLLLANINKNSLNEVYSDLWLKNPDQSADDYKISSKNYSLFFRVLYNSTYLNRKYSEEALKILSQANFKDGLVAGVGENVLVAHKYGESVNQVNGDGLQVELHDCGIVYRPQKPYILCVMTKGSKLDDLKTVIKDISTFIYNNTK